MKTTSALARWRGLSQPLTVRWRIRSASFNSVLLTSPPPNKRSRHGSKNVATVSIFCQGARSEALMAPTSAIS